MIIDTCSPGCGSNGKCETPFCEDYWAIDYDEFEKKWGNYEERMAKCIKNKWNLSSSLKEGYKWQVFSDNQLSACIHPLNMHRYIFMKGRNPWKHSFLDKCECEWNLLDHFKNIVDCSIWAIKYCLFTSQRAYRMNDSLKLFKNSYFGRGILSELDTTADF